MNYLKKKFTSLRKFLSAATFSPSSLALSTGLIAFLYALNEWVFIITKPSSLNLIPGYEKWLLLLNFSALWVLVCLILLLPINIYTLITKKYPSSIVLNLFAVLPTIVLATLVLMMIDNFTYTVFNFGIISASSLYRLFYTILYLVLLVLLYKPVIGFTRFIDEVRIARPAGTRRFGMITLGLLLCFGILLPLLLRPAEESEAYESNAPTTREALPNVLLITVDGLDAANMSVYGFGVKTTPFLEELAPSALVAENAFANAQGTVGSISSILSGKDPLDLHVLFSNDVLKGVDATQHLPGLLKSYGYYTFQLSYSTYTDAYIHNLQGAFDEASGRRYPSGGWFFEKIDALFSTDNKIFLQEAVDRPLTRLGHIFFVLDMDNPYKQVTEGGIVKTTDQQKIDRTLSILSGAEQPTFIHLHWMGTHGPKYYPEEQVFSKGRPVNAQQKYENEFYYDSILDLDNHLKDLYIQLDQQGLIENTVLILASDHTQKWTNGRIPLMMHFPENEYAQTINRNVQNLDIAPTLLDYLGIHQPAWMPGDSLLHGMPESRPIFTSKIPKSIKDPITGKVSYPISVAPFYQFGRMSVILCDTWYELDTTNLVMTSGKVKGYSRDCQDQSGSMQEALNLISSHFEEYGYDAKTLQQTIFEQD